MNFIKRNRQLIAKIENKEEHSGRCYYYMYHWGSGKESEINSNFFETNKKFKLLSKSSVTQLKEICKSIIYNLHGIKAITEYNIYPEILWTEKAYTQRPHIDRDESNLKYTQQLIVVHIPLNNEGMLLCTWEDKKTKFMDVPHLDA